MMLSYCLFSYTNHKFCENNVMKSTITWIHDLKYHFTLSIRMVGTMIKSRMRMIIDIG